MRNKQYESVEDALYFFKRIFFSIEIFKKKKFP